jgi:hypothetical protein
METENTTSEENKPVEEIKEFDFDVEEFLRYFKKSNENSYMALLEKFKLTQ